jgi:hypothetical protein
MWIETLALVLGTQPSSLGTKYEAPSVWASVGQIANIIKRILATLCAHDHVPLIAAKS